MKSIFIYISQAKDITIGIGLNGMYLMKIVNLGETKLKEFTRVLNLNFHLNAITLCFKKKICIWTEKLSIQI